MFSKGDKSSLLLNKAPSVKMLIFAFIVMMMSLFSTYASEADYQSQFLEEYVCDSGIVSWKCSKCGRYNSVDRDDSWGHTYRCRRCGSSK